jgi:hypothetical protein
MPGLEMWLGRPRGYGARADIPDADGMTAAPIMARKKDDRFRRLAEKLGAAPRPRGRRSAWAGGQLV